MTKKPKQSVTLPETATRNLKALELAISVVSNPLFTLNDTPLSRDIKGIISLAEIFSDFANGKQVIHVTTPEKQGKEEAGA